MRIKDDNEIKNILKIVSPGTNLREGLENILRAKTGGLIVLGDSEEVMNIVDGGFNINAEYTPAYIYELAKTKALKSGGTLHVLPLIAAQNHSLGEWYKKA